MTGRRPDLGLKKIGKPGSSLAKPNSALPIPTPRWNVEKTSSPPTKKQEAEPKNTTAG